MPINEGRGPHPPAIEGKKNLTLRQAHAELAAKIDRIPNDSDLKNRVLAYLDEAQDILDRLRGGDLSYPVRTEFVADVKRARELTQVLQHFSQSVDGRINAGEPTHTPPPERVIVEIGPQRRYLQELRQRIHALSNDVDVERQPARSRGVHELYEAIDLLDQLLARATSTDLVQNIQSGLESIAARLVSLEQSHSEYRLDPKQIIDRQTPHPGYEREVGTNRMVKPVPEFVSVAPRISERNDNDHYAEEEATRQRYEELLQKRNELNNQLNSWKSIFRRGELRLSLEAVQRNLARYEAKFPFVTQPRSLSTEAGRRMEQRYQADRMAKATQPNERRDAINKTIALERADASLQLDYQHQQATAKRRTHVMEPKDYHLSSNTAIQKLDQLLQQAPKNWKAYQTWKIQAAAAEAYLPNLFSLGSAEQHQVTDYWAKKIFMLEQVRPLLFGRADWQKEYDQAYTARRAAISEGLKRRAS